MAGNSQNSVADLAYTYGYFRELSPAFLSAVALSYGYEVKTGPGLNYLELGVGQGVSLAVHAAANNGAYWGNDYNHAHIEHAAELAVASGANAHLLVDSFADFLARADTPAFDIIALHGIWSWVRPEDHDTIIEIARRKLSEKGLLYVSYNCRTGWAGSLPFRELMRLHAETESAADMPVPDKVDAALGFMRRLSTSGTSYFRTHPRLIDLVNRMEHDSRDYLAHEFFGVDWILTSFAEVAERLAEARLNYAGTAMLLRNHRSALSDEGRLIVAGLKSPALQEAVKDAFISAQFREDLFIKGQTAPLSTTERIARFRERRFFLAIPPRRAPAVVAGLRGDEIQLSGDMRLLIAAMGAERHAPKSIAQLEAATGLSAETVIEYVLLMMGMGLAFAAQDKVDADQVREQCRALNAFLCARAKENGNVGVLAAPELGAAIEVGRMGQLFVLARQEGNSTHAAQAAFVWRYLHKTGERLYRQGQAIPPSESEAELARMAAGFEAQLWPILQGAGIV